MKILKYIAVVVVSLLVVFVGVGMMLPTTTHVERSVDISAPKEVVFKLVSEHKEFERWSPWSEMDPNMKMTYSGPDVGIGSKSEWDSENSNVGKGSSEFVEYNKPTRAKTKLVFEGHGEAYAYYDLSDTETGTRIVWGFDTKLDGLVSRYMGLIMESMLGPVYEQGLAKLKAIAEAEPALSNHSSSNVNTEIVTSEIEYKVGDTNLTGFLAYPNTGNKSPGIIIVHEWWGHNDYVRRRAKMLAELGYSVFALDMYGDGKLADHPEKAKEFMMQVVNNAETAKARFDAGVDLLKQQVSTDTDNIAAIGYCFGGAVVMSMARSGADLKGVVSFHGGLNGLAPIASEGVSASVLVLNGQDDPFVAEEHKTAFKSEMDAANIQYEFVDYPGVVHSFTNPDADKFGEQFELPLKYDEAADKDSWQRMQNFFNQVFAS